jgi:hypothetical protein
VNVILSEAKNPLCPLHLLLPNMPLLFALGDCHSERSEESLCLCLKKTCIPPCPCRFKPTAGSLSPTIHNI